MTIPLEKLDAVLQNTLIKANLTSAHKIIQLSESSIRQEGNITKEDAKLILELAAETLLPQENLSAVRMRLKQNTTLSTGCDQIDLILNGGIPLQGITELSGESSCGKTQLCLQLCLTVQYPTSVGGLNKGAVFISTEDNFPSKRLQQLIQNFPLEFSKSVVSQLEENHNFGSKIFIEHIGDTDGLKRCLYGQLPRLLSTQDIGLLIIDSIAGVFRADYDLKDGLRRARDMRSVASQLQKIAHDHSIVILCVNQVTASLKQSGLSSKPIPALGLVWANLVTTRIFMSRSTIGNFRTLEVLFAPHLPKKSCQFTIGNAGISCLD
nr:PREDICTED: DNA repair protein XRCC3-like [Bemisia tabaci]XP_018906545.1 PREDICTED: DNA repair protein XRCC3-like [Bemisia tabaci]